MYDQVRARPGDGTTTFVFPDLPKAFSPTCPEPTIPKTVSEPEPDEAGRPTEPPDDEPQA